MTIACLTNIYIVFAQIDFTFTVNTSTYTRARASGADMFIWKWIGLFVMKFCWPIPFESFVFFHQLCLLRFRNNISFHATAWYFPDKLSPNFDLSHCLFRSSISPLFPAIFRFLCADWLAKIINRATIATEYNQYLSSSNLYELMFILT